MNMKRRIWNRRFSARRDFPSAPASSRQRGAVLLIALVVLVVMTLSALALIRSVTTTNLVAGNLAFREAAVLSSERATESAITDLLTLHAAGEQLKSDHLAMGYHAKRSDPVCRKYPPDAADCNAPVRYDWEKFWNDIPGGSKKVALLSDNATSTDTAGNKVEYVIHRLCDAYLDSDDLDNNCSRPPHAGDGDSKVIPGASGILLNHQVYYRITARVEGPRNTVAYTQTIIAL
jgi:hypothetical protein